MEHYSRAQCTVGRGLLRQLAKNSHSDQQWFSSQKRSVFSFLSLSCFNRTRTSYPTLEPVSLQQSCCCVRPLALRLVLMTFANGPKLPIPCGVTGE